MTARLHKLLLTLAALAGLAQNTRAAVNFTVSPASVSNTYNGTITLLVTGLNPGETVVIQKYLDANTNGVVDAGDVLWQQFVATDGQPGMVIGGVTNFNVPGDTDSTSGQITVVQTLQLDFSQTDIGQYLFLLSSPSNHFAPITKAFAVTNFPYPQKFTGTVVSNGVAVPFAAVILFQPSGGDSLNPVAGTVANGLGVYTIGAPPATYLLAAFHSNFVADTTAAANLVLSNGATFHTNLSLIPATETISGRIVDATNSGLGLPGLLVPVQTKAGLLGVCFTDSNGNFSAGVTANQWGIGSDSGSLATHGYLGLDNKTGIDTTGGSVASQIISLPRATALVYGRLADNLGNPLSQVVAIEAYDDNSNVYQSDGYTGTNGNYVTAVVGGLGANDLWYVDVDNKSSFSNYVFSQPLFDQNNGTNISAGQAVLANITVVPGSNSISGNVKAGGTNIVGVQVFANIFVGGTNYETQMDTDSQGNYSLNVPSVPGIYWYVGVNCQGGSESLDGILGSGNYQCPNGANIIMNGSNVVANFNVTICSLVQITTTNLPAGQVGVFYDQFLQGLSCSGGITWSLNDPQHFPASLNFETSGEIHGTPGTASNYTFSVHASDGTHTTNQTLSLAIAPGFIPLQITTTSLPGATQNAPYNTTLLATGGYPPYQWSLAPGSASLPYYLSLGTNGAISGTPVSPGTTDFYAEVTDSSSASVDQFLALTVAASTNHPVVMLQSPQFKSGQFQFTFDSAAGVKYTLQVSTNLSNWIATSSLTGSGGPLTFSDLTVGPGQRFYRLQIGP